MTRARIVAAVAVIALAVTSRRARADDLVGLRLGIGREPVPADRRTVFTDGLSWLGKLGAGFRAGGELDLEYLLGDTHAAMDTRGFGVRGGLVARHAIVRGDWRGASFFIDGEAGAGVVVGHDSRLGSIDRPDAFAGVRAGYDLPARARYFEGAFDFRVIATPDGAAWMFGVGLGWGR